MNNFESENHLIKFEHSLINDKEYFNSKFPPVGDWLGVEVTMDELEYIGIKMVDVKRDRVKVTVKADNTTARATSQVDIFVCYYTLGDQASRLRAEDMLGKIYPIFSKTE